MPALGVLDSVFVLVVAIAIPLTIAGAIGAWADLQAVWSSREAAALRVIATTSFRRQLGLLAIAIVAVVWSLFGIATHGRPLDGVSDLVGVGLILVVGLVDLISADDLVARRVLQGLGRSGPS